ncbi:MAG: dihydrodipicolinate synthase family protein [Oscillospiraceae bacterium]
MPGMTHNPITPKVVQEVCDTCPNVAGLKDSSMDFLTFQEFQCLELPEGFELITGNDAQVLPVLQSGGDGAIIAMASVFPKQCQQLWDCYYAGELEQARRIQRMLLEAARAGAERYARHGPQKMLELQGFHMGPARFPFRDLSGEESRTIEEGLEKLLGQVG